MLYKILKICHNIYNKIKKKKKSIYKNISHVSYAFSFSFSIIKLFLCEFSKINLIYFKKWLILSLRNKEKIKSLFLRCENIMENEKRKTWFYQKNSYYIHAINRKLHIQKVLYINIPTLDYRNDTWYEKKKINIRSK